MPLGASTTDPLSPPPGVSPLGRLVPPPPPGKPPIEPTVVGPAAIGFDGDGVLGALPPVCVPVPRPPLVEPAPAPLPGPLEPPRPAPAPLPDPIAAPPDAPPAVLGDPADG